MESPFKPNDQAAEFVGLSPRTLERLRVEGRGPVFRRHGRRILYATKDLLAWSDGHRRVSTSQPAHDAA